MITVAVPVAAVALAVRVNVLVEVAGFGLNVAVTPLGKPEAVSETLLLKPFKDVMSNVLIASAPWGNVNTIGLDEIV